MTMQEIDDLRERLSREGEHLCDGECRSTYWLLDGILWFEASWTQITWNGTPQQWAEDLKRRTFDPLYPSDLRLLVALERRFPGDPSLAALRQRHEKMQAIYR
jgi:hypothetical protein